MKCKECEYCNIITDDTGYAELRCMAKSKKGKVLEWAHTIVYPTHESGADRLRNINAPKRCPKK